MEDRTELWLVRHGETPSAARGTLCGSIDDPLTERGRRQASGVRAVLREHRFDSVWSSDLARARSTAEAAWGVARVDRRLREMGFGELEGRTWEGLEEHHRQAMIDCTGFEVDGAETFPELRQRLLGFVDELPAGRHLLFTHGLVIRTLVRESGGDGLVPPGTVVAIDWTGRTVLWTREPEE